eukprot:365803-Chlamydomonas_euryale.AAC.3
MCDHAHCRKRVRAFMCGTGAGDGRGCARVRASLGISAPGHVLTHCLLFEGSDWAALRAHMSAMCVRGLFWGQLLVHVSASQAVVFASVILQSLRSCGRRMNSVALGGKRVGVVAEG